MFVYLINNLCEIIQCICWRRRRKGRTFFSFILFFSLSLFFQSHCLSVKGWLFCAEPCGLVNARHRVIFGETKRILKNRGLNSTTDWLDDKMQSVFIRTFATSRIEFQRYQPRFVNTIKETVKSAQEKSYSITRPLGLSKPVLLNHKLSDTYSLSNIYEELFGQKSKERRQKQLDYDLKHSPIYEVKSFENTKGKIFTPPVSYFRQVKSLYFPDFIAKTLAGNQRSLYDSLDNRLSIVKLFSSVAGEQCTRSYFKVENKDYYSQDYDTFVEEYPHTQILDVNMPQSWIKGFVTNLSTGNLRKTLKPALRYENYFILPGHIMSAEIREQLYCDNQCSGYIYIVDSMGKIRWATSGYATPEDLKLMWKVVKGVQREMTK